MTTPMFTEEAMIARLKELEAKRDAVYAKNAPLQAALDKANLAAEQARLQAAAISTEIQENLGGQAWLQLKKEIKLIRSSLGRPNGPLADL